MPDPVPDPSGWVRPDLGELAGGTVHDVVLWPDARLRQVCQPAGYLTGPDLLALARDMLATMYAAGGRGLAGPQIGVLRRIFVMDAGWKDAVPDPIVVIDPEIVARGSRTGIVTEMCLSIPDRPVPVERPLSVTMAFFDLLGQHRVVDLTGPAARIAQHEADHLDGRLIVGD